MTTRFELRAPKSSLALKMIALTAFPLSATAQVFTFQGHSYQVTPSIMNWTQAEAVAVTMGGHLAAINSQAEQDFLVSTFVVPSTPGGDRQPFWIGLTDVNHSPIIGGAGQNFQWTTGEPFTYSNWNPGEPNNNTGNEWYVAFNFHYGVNQSNTPGTWNDTTDVGSVPPNPYRGIIEIAGVPEPGSAVFVGLVMAAGVVVRRCRAGRRCHIAEALEMNHRDARESPGQDNKFNCVEGLP
jgi:hypothetical protein